MGSNPKETFDIRRYLKVIWKRKVLIIIPFLIVTGMGIWGSYQLTPIFQSTTVVMLRDTKLLTRPIEAMVPGGQENDLTRVRKEQSLATIEAQILSSLTLKELISRLELDKEPWVIKMKASLEREKSPKPAQELLAEKMLLDNLRENISVDLKGENLLEIKVTSPSPEKAAQMAEALMDIFIKQSLEDELLGIKQATDFSDEQLEYYKTQLQASEDTLRQFKAKYVQTELGDTMTQRNRIAEIGSLVAATKLQIEDIKEQLDVLAQQIKKQNVGIPNLRTSKSLKDKENQLLVQARQYAELLTSTSARDVQALALNMKMEEAFKDIEIEIKGLTDSQLKGELLNLKSQIEQYNLKNIRQAYLEDKLAFLNQSYGRLRDVLVGRVYYESVLRNLEHEAEMKQRIYELFISQAQGSQISQEMSKAVSTNRFKIIEPAKIPIRPIRPDKRMIAMFSGLMGLIIGIAAVIMAETLDHSFRDVEEVESYLNVKVLGTVSKIDKLNALFKK
ncbi:MAG: GNVR domain-containing protein [Candidatus Zixiibacteriota bacterium]